MDEKRGCWSGFSPTPVNSLHYSLRHFVELKPWRDGSEQWVQPLSEAYNSVLEKLCYVRVVANLIYEYLPTYSCWVHNSYHQDDTSLIVRSASFSEENVLHLDVIGDGWESHRWLDKWSESDRKTVCDTDHRSRRNFCGIILWRERVSFNPGDPGSNYFQIREQRDTEEERMRWIKHDKIIHADCPQCQEDPDDQVVRICAHTLLHRDCEDPLRHMEDTWLESIFDEMVWEARHWNRTISGSDDKTDIVVPLLSRSDDIPTYQPCTLPFHFNNERAIPASQMQCHVDYLDWQNQEKNKDHANMNLIQADLYVALPASTLVTHEHPRTSDAALIKSI